MIESIQIIKAVKVLDFKSTKGSAPLRVLCDDGNLYYAKTTEPKSPPYPELINEVICNYYCKEWGLLPPTSTIITISNEVVSAYLEENDMALPIRYREIIFDQRLFYGSQIINNQVEIERYIVGLSNKREYNKFENPFDLIKVAALDLWIGNKDRKPDNPNLLLSESIDSKFNFHPIDHTAALGYQSNFKALKTAHLHVEDKYCLLNTQLSSSILTFASKENCQNLTKEITDCIDKCLDQSNEIFNQVPSDWGFSKKAKKRVLEVLADNDRNGACAQSFIRFIKRK